MDAIPISEGRKQLFKLREQVVDDSNPVILTHKKGNVVLISMDEWESYKETELLLRDTEALKALLQSFEDHDARKTKGVTVEEAFSDLS